jgi:hypothetical protein
LVLPRAKGKRRSFRCLAAFYFTLRHPCLVPVAGFLSDLLLDVSSLNVLLGLVPFEIFLLDQGQVSIAFNCLRLMNLKGLLSQLVLPLMPAFLVLSEWLRLLLELALLLLRSLVVVLGLIVLVLCHFVVTVV